MPFSPEGLSEVLRGTVSGLESVREPAIGNAKHNGVKNARFFAADATAWIREAADAGQKADVVFMDPPREGSTPAFIESVARMAPKRIVYVSCNPETMARDLALLTQKGYRAEGFTQEKAVSATRNTVADPGASEHHTGLAFDITVAGTIFKGTEQQIWLHKHCWDYGFIIRYQEDKEDITGFLAECWHIRYVGLPHSTEMRDRNLCLEEYLGEA